MKDLAEEQILEMRDLMQILKARACQFQNIKMRDFHA